MAAALPFPARTRQNGRTHQERTSGMSKGRGLRRGYAWAARRARHDKAPGRAQVRGGGVAELGRRHLGSAPQRAAARLGARSLRGAASREKGDPTERGRRDGSGAAGWSAHPQPTPPRLPASLTENATKTSGDTAEQAVVEVASITAAPAAARGRVYPISPSPSACPRARAPGRRTRARSHALCRQACPPRAVKRAACHVEGSAEGSRRGAASRMRCVAREWRVERAQEMFLCCFGRAKAMAPASKRRTRGITGDGPSRPHPTSLTKGPEGALLCIAHGRLFGDRMNE